MKTSKIFKKILWGMAGVVCSAQAETTDLQGPQPIVLLHYDQIQVEHDSQIVTVTGDVVAAYKDKQIKADRLIYDPKKDQIWASGHVCVHDATKDVLFGEQMHFEEEWSHGWVQSPRALLADNSRLTGSHAWQVNPQTYVLDRGVYSPCSLCGPDRTPFWQIKAQRVVDDRKTHDISYHHVRLELGNGIPILYSPYLSHPGPGVRRRSGILTPSLLFSSQNGFGIQVPYYYTLSPQRDITLTPIFTEKGGALLKGEYRQRTLHSSWELSGSLMPTKREDKAKAEAQKERLRSWRGHLVSSLRHELSDEWLLSSHAQFVSDQTYLRRYPYFGSTEASFLTSSGTLERYEGSSYWGLKGYFFEPLAQDTSFQQAPKILPSIEYDKFIETEGPWTQRVGYHVLNLRRTFGNQMVRAVVQHDLRGHYVVASHGVFSPFLESRIDGYHTQRSTDPDKPIPIAFQYPFYGTRCRLLPTFGGRLSWPLVQPKAEGFRMFEPYVMALTTPLLGSMGSDMLREDTLDMNLTTMSLFQTQPFSGFDYVQTGTRAHWGGRWTEHTARGHIWMFEWGHLSLLSRPTFRQNAEQIKYSILKNAHMGTIDYRSPSGHHKARTRFLFDQKSTRPRRWEMGWLWTPAQKYEVQLSYAMGQPQTYPQVVQRFSSVTGAFQCPLPREGWHLKVESVLDTNRHWKPLTQGAQLVYTNDCFTSNISIQKRFYRDREVKPDTTFFITLSFKNLGSFSTGLDSQSNASPLENMIKR